MRTLRTKKLFLILLGASLLLLLYRFSGSVDDSKHVKEARELQESSSSRHLQHVLDKPQLQAQTSSKQVPVRTTTVQTTEKTCTGVDCVLRNVQTCLRATNMATKANESIALSNAREFYERFRKVIPSDFLPDYSSHCWKMHFSVREKVIYFMGQLGQYPFKEGYNGQATELETLQSLHNVFKGSFSSELVCLPNVFLAGFPKCGSTYAYCFLQSLIHLSTGLDMDNETEVVKEPHFWVRVRVTKHIQWPKPTDLAEYIINFLPGIHKIDSLKKKEVMLMDGTPNMLFDWPRFDVKQPNTSNYCLLTSALPELLPKSKFILITRNPLKMLYSAFWYSCITKGIVVPRKTQLLGPDLFHKRIKAKIDLFNDCMRDSSSEEISEPCSLVGDSDYGSCITKRLHLLDTCVHKITFNLFSPELPDCGRSRVEMGLYYNHIRKLLTVVPREKVLVFTLEQLAKEPRVIAKQVLEFLELPVTNRAHVLDQVKVAASSCSKNSQEAIPYKTDPLLRMKEETRTMILKFYKPFNALLADLLGDNKFLQWDP